MRSISSRARCAGPSSPKNSSGQPGTSSMGTPLRESSRSGLLLRVIPARHKVNELGPRAFVRERPHLVQKLGPAARLRAIGSVKSPGYADGDENRLGISRLYTCRGLSRPHRSGTSIGEAERPRKARGTLVHARVPRSLAAGRSGSPTRHRSQRSPESRALRPQGALDRRPHGRETRSRP